MKVNHEVAILNAGRDLFSQITNIKQKSNKSKKFYFDLNFIILYQNIVILF